MLMMVALEIKNKKKACKREKEAHQLIPLEIMETLLSKQEKTYSHITLQTPSVYLCKNFQRSEKRFTRTNFCKNIELFSRPPYPQGGYIQPNITRVLRL